MASAAYELGIEKIGRASINLHGATHDIRCRMTRASAYTFSQAHEFASSLPAAIATDVSLGNKTYALGVWDADDAVFVAVPAGAAIDQAEFFRWVSAAGDSPLVLHLDGFSVTPNGGDITLQWAAASPKIWKIAP